MSGHGTRACYVRGCRLPICVEANRVYQRDRARQRRAVELNVDVAQVHLRTNRRLLSTDTLIELGRLDTSWKAHGACTAGGPEVTALFFPRTGQVGVPEALELCRRCLVALPCLEYALATDSLGVWGGTTEADRKRLREVAS